MPDTARPDSFELALRQVLFAPDSVANPEIRFATRLRARLERSLTLPKGVDVTITTLDPPAELTRIEVTPYLAVDGARAALDWYSAAFGARLRGEPLVMPDGRVGHAELDFGGGTVMLSDHSPDIGVAAPRPGAGSSVTIHLNVADVDALVRRAQAEGAVVDRPPRDAHYGRNAVLVDPFGHRWLLSSPPAAVRPWYPSGTRHGDVGYISIEVPDLELATAFYGAVLGWAFGPASSPQGRSVLDSMPDTGLSGGHPQSMPVVCWRVDDLVGAIEVVRRRGGSATEPDPRPYGTLSDCTDDQGMRFYLWQPSGDEVAAGAAVTERPLNGTRHGDLSYLTLQVADTERFRAFFGEVLGWTFSPGHVADGWGVSDPMPMHGISGGHDEATAVPMWRVDDIAAAVERVLAGGGTSTALQRQPYGLSCECTDDQGTRFYLHQE